VIFSRRNKIFLVVFSLRKIGPVKGTGPVKDSSLTRSVFYGKLEKEKVL
jgi:hypothetical protein